MKYDTSGWYKDIRDFMEAAGQTVSYKPSQLSIQDAELRARLILEEALETCHALGVAVTLGEQEVTFEDLSFESVYPTHTLKLVDGCCDVIVVTLGTLVSAGIPDIPFMDEVNQNNLTKVKPVCKIVNGKVQKPDNYQPPKLSDILMKLYEETQG